MTTPASYKMTGGRLIFGTGGSAHDMSIQVTSCELEPSEQVDRDDDVDVLTGDVLYGDETITYEWVLKGTILQDSSLVGSVVWSAEHAGEEWPFNFEPVDGLRASGTVIIAAIKLGGQAKTRPTTDFNFRLKRGTAPTFEEF
jgi:hypothetical protein